MRVKRVFYRFALGVDEGRFVTVGLNWLRLRQILRFVDYCRKGQFDRLTVFDTFIRECLF